MKKALKVIVGFFLLVPFIVGSCMIRDTEDFPDFNEQLQKDLAAIDSYLASKNLTPQQDDGGFIRYVIYRDSIDTKKPTIDSCVTVHYEGRLLSNGVVFDYGEGVSFPVSSLIDGWKIGLPLLNEGDSVTLFVPSGLGYGFYGSQEIPANANLMFDIALHKVGSTYRNSDRSCN